MREDDALRRRLAAAPPDFAPVSPGAVRARSDRRRRIGAAVTAGGAAVLAAAVVLAPRLAPDPSTTVPPAAGSASAGPTPAVRECPPRNPGGVVDYVPFVRLNGVLYGEAGERYGGARPAVGPRVGEVRCTLADIQPGPDYRSVDGDASFLRAGTALHATPGVPAAFRLVTPDGQVFEAIGADRATTGADLLPLQGLVTSIDVRGPAGDLPPGREPPLRRRITDPVQVRAVLDGIAAAPVVDRNATTETGRLLFRLTDGTVVRRDWSTPDRMLEGRIELPAAVLALLAG